MELLSKLHEAVVEFESKKYSIDVDGTNVLFKFEKAVGALSGTAKLNIEGSNVIKVEYDFDCVEDLVLSDSFTAESLIGGEEFFGRDLKDLVYRGVALLKQYLSPEFIDGVGRLSDVEADYQKLIKEYISDHSANSISFHPSLVFKKDIVCDELNFIELVMAIENSFKVDLPDDSMEGDVTYGDILRIIQGKIPTGSE
tara:strand:- start:4698 stop:5291 length:594 start_codon:yes stop_codon:yes gene_type:complete